MTIVKPRIPVISNVDAKTHSDPDVIKQILAKQVHVYAHGTCTCTYMRMRMCIHAHAHAHAHTCTCTCTCTCARHAHGMCTRHAHGICTRHARTKMTSCQRATTSCQVTAPVQWESIMQGLIDGGLEKGYELGPGKVLAGIMKRVDKTKVIENIEV